MLDRNLLLVQIQYPGLTWVESRVMAAWIDAHSSEWDQIEFNVRLGSGVGAQPDLLPEFQRMAHLLSQKRADAIVARQDQVRILEIKNRITPIVVGELMVYRDLYVREFPGDRPVTLGAVGRAIVPDIQETLAAVGITVELYPGVQVPEGTS